MLDFFFANFLFSSGKTLAYLVPAFVHIWNQKPLMTGEGPLALGEPYFHMHAADEVDS